VLVVFVPTAIRTPTWVQVVGIGTLTGSTSVSKPGTPLFAHTVRLPSEVPCFFSCVVAITLPSHSLMNVASATDGSVSGTAIGNIPVATRSCLSETRARASIQGTLNGGTPKNHGRSRSVILTSMNLLAHGLGPSSSASLRQNLPG
jgi:hypothetical protein